ncbi:hypothetical protein Salat_2429700 [Sesamum alatum]|uniref:Uncharacterized protein n=1 Tax=Sesamum alatum TaxID=300844 RepID=A0AAE2CFF8_9LAMI|nr:hypothetical protein Salat_2429700 [Sesamum alatum]
MKDKHETPTEQIGDKEGEGAEGSDSMASLEIVRETREKSIERYVEVDVGGDHQGIATSDQAIDSPIPKICIFNQQTLRAVEPPGKGCIWTTQPRTMMIVTMRNHHEIA